MSKSRSNRKIRIALARIFGEGCMFKKSHAEQYIEKLGNIKTYRIYKREKHYTPKQVRQLEAWLTLHHLKHRAEGGATTIENGAIINELAHRYMHSLPRSQEEIINDYLREWKKAHYEKFEIELVEDLEEKIELDIAEIEVEENRLKVKKYNRAKEKEKLKEQIKNYYENR